MIWNSTISNRPVIFSDSFPYSLFARRMVTVLPSFIPYVTVEWKYKLARRTRYG